MLTPPRARARSKVARPSRGLLRNRNPWAPSPNDLSSGLQEALAGAGTGEPGVRKTQPLRPRLGLKTAFGDALRPAAHQRPRLRQRRFVRTGPLRPPTWRLSHSFARCNNVESEG